MPYSKSYRRYRSRSKKTRTMGGIRRRYTGRRRPMTSGKVKRIIDAELKFLDLSVGPAAMPTNGVNVRMTAIGQGDSANERNGNWVKPVSWMGTITVTGNETADPDLIPQFRVGVYCWKENEEINPATVAKVMADASDPHLGFNILNKGQFKILWSRTGILSNQNQNPQFTKMLRFYVKPPMKVLYDDADTRNNQLFLFFLSDTDAAANPPTFTFSSRLRYTDS